jgi:hypothetical protein
VPTHPGATIPAPADELLSPELVLVDPALAARARDRLSPPGPPACATPEPPDTVAAVDAAAAATRRLARQALASQDADELRAPPFAPARRRRLAAVSVTCATVAIALLATERALQRDASSVAAPAAAEDRAQPAEPRPTAAAPSSAAPPPSPRSPSARPDAAPAPAPRRFVWAPVADATGYHVELFREANRVFAADTTRAAITIPTRWRFDGRPYRLEPVEYRWYVWPIVSGRRSSEAIVQARLVVRDR